MLLFGLALRVYGIDREVVQGDEIHALVAALRETPAEIVETFDEADRCVPLTLYSWMIARTIGLDEVTFRVPSIVAGVGLLLVAFVLGRCLRLRSRELLVVLAVLATSPVLVYWSRIARPYAVVAVLGAVGMLMAVALSKSRSWRIRVAFVVSQSLMHVFSLTSLPVTAGICAAGMFWEGSARERSRRERMRGALVFGALGFTSLALTVLLYLPAFGQLSDVVATKAGQSAMTADTAVGVAHLALGLCAPPAGEGSIVAACGGVLVALGFVRTARRRRRLSITIAVAIVFPLIGHGIFGARAIDNPIAYTRYVAGIVPLVLALAGLGLMSVVQGLASGIVGIGRRVSRTTDEESARSSTALATRWAPSITLLVLASFVAFGPLPRSLATRSSFGLRASCLVNVGGLADRVDAGRAPLWYASSDARSASRIFEWPAVPAPRHLYALYQTMHGRPVVSVHPSDPPGRGARFGSFTFGAHAAVRRIVEEGGCLVVHRDPPQERLHIAALPIEGEGRGRGRRPPGLARVLSEVERSLGPPVFEDDWIVVFGPPAGAD